jgi:hypothetical protein
MGLNLRGRGRGRYGGFVEKFLRVFEHMGGFVL